MTSIYAPFLCRLYIDKRLHGSGIPYLRSRRQLYYDLKKIFPNEKAMKALDKIGEKHDLLSLDNRIGQSIIKWSRKTV